MRTTALCLNARGVESSVDEILEIANTENADLVFISETWLRPRTCIHTTWTTHRWDEPEHPNRNRGAGGLMLLIRPDFPFITSVSIHDPYRITLRCGGITYHFLYIPPSVEDKEIETIFRPLTQARGPTIIMGDLNARMRRTGDPVQTPRGRILSELMDKISLTALNTRYAFGQRTHFSNSGGTVLDIALANVHAEELAEEFKVLDVSPCSSDHVPIVLTMNMRIIERRPKSIKVAPTFRRIASVPPAVQKRYQQIRDDLLQGVESMIEEIDLQNVNADAGALVDTANATFIAAMYSALEMVGKPAKRRPYWEDFWSGHLADLARQRRRLLRRARQASFRVWRTLQNQVMKLNRAIKKEIRRRKRQGFLKFAEEIGRLPGSEVLATIKAISRRRAAKAPEGATTIEALVDHFRSAFRATDIPHSWPIASMDGLEDTTRVWMDQGSFGTWMAMLSCSRRKSPGPDGLTIEHFLDVDKHMNRKRKPPNQTARTLDRLFHLAWKSGITPKSWNEARLVPIFKNKGSVTEASNYRPISMTSTIRKIFERAIMEHVRSIIEPLDICQGGFRRCRGTVEQAVNLHEICLDIRRKTRKWPSIGFLDIKSAYDRVDHMLLWQRLRDIQCPPRTLDIIRSLFHQSSIRIEYNGEVSDRIYTTCGVMQGAILSPMLYALYIDTLPQTLRDCGMGWQIGGTDVPCLLFADDVALIATTTTQLQQMLDISARHAEENRYTWAPAKCEAVGPETTQELKLNGQTVRWSPTFKYLGIWFQCTGYDTGKHIKDRVEKTQRGIQAMRSIGMNAHGYRMHTNLLIYKGMIRPKLEYGVIGMKISAKEMKQLQKVQNQALRMILGTGGKTSINGMHLILGLAKVDTRIQDLRARFLYRMDTNLLNTLHKRIWKAMNASNADRRWPRSLLRLMGNSEPWITIATPRLDRNGDKRSRLLDWRLNHERENRQRMLESGIVCRKLRTDGQKSILISNREINRRVQSFMLRLRLGTIAASRLHCARCGERLTTAHVYRCYESAAIMNITGTSSTEEGVAQILNTRVEWLTSDRGIRVLKRWAGATMASVWRVRPP
jgi:endonuclease/exonuclease/phosphatase (EEP) superfamily protein YafD